MMIITPLAYALSVTVLPLGLGCLSASGISSFFRWTNHKRSDCNRKRSFHVYSEFGIAWNKWELLDKVGSDRQRHGCVRRDKDHGRGCAQ
jgi:hypothetical protein